MSVTCSKWVRRDSNPGPHEVNALPTHWPTRHHVCQSFTRTAADIRPGSFVLKTTSQYFKRLSRSYKFKHFPNLEQSKVFRNLHHFTVTQLLKPENKISVRSWYANMLNLRQSAVMITIYLWPIWFHQCMQNRGKKYDTQGSRTAGLCQLILSDTQKWPAFLKT